MSVKIQIASLEALERLLGGDTSLEIEVRQSVAENFSRKHIKNSLNKELLNVMVKQEIAEVNAQIFAPRANTYNTPELRPEIKAKLAVAVEYSLTTGIREIVAEEVRRWTGADKLQNFIEAQAKYIADEWTNTNILKRIDARAEAIIKERLGLK